MNFGFLLLIILMTGCGKKEIVPHEKMPTMSELQNYYYSHTQEEYDAKVREIQDILDATSYEEFCKILTEAFKEWEESQKLLAKATCSIDFVKDDLLMNDEGNEKLYNNLFVTVDIYYDRDENKKLNHNLLFDQLKEALRKTPFGGYKINSITVNCYDKKKGMEPSFAGKITGETTNFYLNNEILSVRQTEDEKNIQSVAYRYIKGWNDEAYSTSQESKYGEIRLKRFGIQKDQGNLYVEVLIHSLPAGMEKKPFFDTLEGRGQGLSDSIMADHELKKYLESHGASTVKVTFHTPWGSDYADENDYHTYEYRIEK